MIPGERILDLLARRYGLEVIDGPVEAVDPVLHHVVEVAGNTGEGSSGREERTVPLSRGYRIGERVIRPLQLKVLRGGSGTRSSSRQDGGGEPSRLVLVHNALPQEGPGGAA